MTLIITNLGRNCETFLYPCIKAIPLTCANRCRWSHHAYYTQSTCCICDAFSFAHVAFLYFICKQVLLFSHDWLARKCFLPQKQVLEFSTIHRSFFFFFQIPQFPSKIPFLRSFHRFFTFSCYNRDKSFNIFTYTKRPTFAVDSNCLLDDTFTVLGTFSRRSKMVFRTSRHPYKKY